MIDPAAVTLAQTTFLNHITAVFGVVTGYALNLLYIFATFELVLFGILWAMGQSGWERFFFKVLKIGLIFFVIQNYAYLVDAVVRSLVHVGGLTAGVAKLEHFIFNPAKLWQYGYDNGLILLKFAAVNSSVGMSLILVTLGIGILLAFGLLGIQIILQIVGFYLIALAGLIFLPFGAFYSTRGMFENAVQSVLKAGVRVMVLVMVIGVAVTVWSGFDLVSMSNNTNLNFNINEPLGLFFTSLLFLYLAIKLPQMAAEVVGNISMRLTDQVVVSAPSVSQTVSTQTPMATPISAVQAASVIQTGQTQTTSAGAAVSPVSAAATVVTPSASSGSAMSDIWQSNSQGKDLAKASELYKSISDNTLKRLEKTLENVLQKKGSE